MENEIQSKYGNEAAWDVDIDGVTFRYYFDIDAVERTLTLEARPYYAKKIDSLLTLYYSAETNELVGYDLNSAREIILNVCDPAAIQE